MHNDTESIERMLANRINRTPIAACYTATRTDMVTRFCRALRQVRPMNGHVYQLNTERVASWKRVTLAGR